MKPLLLDQTSEETLKKLRWMAAYFDAQVFDDHTNRSLAQYLMKDRKGYENYSEEELREFFAATCIKEYFFRQLDRFDLSKEEVRSFTDKICGRGD